VIVGTSRRAQGRRQSCLLRREEGIKALVSSPLGAYTRTMTDVLVVVGLVVAFVLLAGFVQLCGRIIGPDPEGVELSTGPTAGEPEVDALEPAA